MSQFRKNGHIKNIDFLIQKHGKSLHLFEYSKCSLSNVLQCFGLQVLHIHFVKLFVLKYYMVSGAIATVVSGWASIKAIY